MIPPTTSELLLLWDQQRDRTLQREIGWSDVGVCRKRAGYRLAGTEPTNPSSSMQAILGTAVHDAVAGAIDTVANSTYLTEQEVTYAGVTGHLDRLHLPSGTLVDVKTTSSRWLEHIKLHGPDEAHKMQLAGYAAGLVKDGKTVNRVRIDYIARDTGEEYNWPSIEGAAFSSMWVKIALEWLKSVRDTPLEMLPRDYLPESAFCRSCPFRDPCWDGHVIDRPSLTVLFVEDPDAEKWAEQLWSARAEEKNAKHRAKVAVGALEALRPMSGTGRVQCGKHTLDFRSNGVYFVSGDAPIPAVGFEDGDAA